MCYQEHCFENPHSLAITAFAVLLVLLLLRPKDKEAPVAPTIPEENRAEPYPEAGIPAAPEEEPLLRLVLPEQDHDDLLASARDRDRKKLPYRFATPVEMGKTTTQIGQWTVANGVAIWSLELESPDAESQNFVLAPSLPSAARWRVCAVGKGRQRAVPVHFGRH